MAPMGFPRKQKDGQNFGSTDDNFK